MIDLRQLTIGVTLGVALIVLGLVPGLFRDLVHGLDQGIRNLRGQWSPMVPVSRERIRYDGQPVWLAGVGSLLIAMAMLAFAS